jgi:hypothetical protein
MEKATKKSPAISGQTRPKAAKSGRTGPSPSRDPKPKANRKPKPDPNSESESNRESELETDPGIESETNRDPAKINPSQQRALLALLEARSIAAAARHTGIGAVRCLSRIFRSSGRLDQAILVPGELEWDNFA